eukprot:10498670-Lingulodinium_polyedra.AAC.1
MHQNLVERKDGARHQKCGEGGRCGATHQKFMNGRGTLAQHAKIWWREGGAVSLVKKEKKEHPSAP